MCGRGSAGLETICGVMGVPPPVFPSAIPNTIAPENRTQSGRGEL